MDFRVAASPAAPIYTRPAAARSAQQVSAPAQDEVVISAAARTEVEAGETSFSSFAEVFGDVTRGYSDAVRAHYAQAHEENLTYDDPAVHIWDKYKNPDSPAFRADLSEEERAWAYDQELDLLNGGKHLQLQNPYAFPDSAPTLASAAAEALQRARTQMDQSVQALLAEHGIQPPADASFRLRVDEANTIRVTGLEDQEQAAAMEDALNRGDNGKILSEHLKLTAPAGVDCEGGHLAAVDDALALDDQALETVKRQAGPAWARYSDTYDPQQGAMNEKLLTLHPDSPLNTPERMDRMRAAVRVGAPEVIAEFRARQNDMNLVINENRDVDPDGSIALETYVRAYAQPAVNARKTIEGYYAEAHAENSRYPLLEGLSHIAEKYKLPDSGIFRADLPQAQRDMAYRQERALLTGARLTLLDPYALAAVGGVQTAQSSHDYAMQAVQARLAAMRR